MLGAGVVLLLGTMSASAATIQRQGDITVAALVPGVPPASTPVITTPISEAIVTTAPITVSGTCTPGLIVKLFRNNSFSGSVLCAGAGTFSLQSDLFLERNDLVARHYDGLDQPGPDSNLIVIYYRPISPVVSTEPTSPATNSGQSLVAPPVVPSDQIILRTNYLFKGIRPDARFSWDLNVSGGRPPYALTIDWGDSSQDLKSQPVAGDLKLAHTYLKAGTYQIVIRARDTADRAAYLEMVAIVDGIVPTAVGRIDGGTSQGQLYLRVLDVLPYFGAAVSVLLAFWLGERVAQRGLLVAAKAVQNSKKS